MNAPGYPVTQVKEPSREEFFTALADAGLAWEHQDILQRHQHPGIRASDGTIALILHTVSFVESSDTIEVVHEETDHLVRELRDRIEPSPGRCPLVESSGPAPA